MGDFQELLLFLYLSKHMKDTNGTRRHKEENTLWRNELRAVQAPVHHAKADGRRDGGLRQQRGGEIIFGVEDKTGRVLGMDYEDIQRVTRELGNTANEQVRPTIYIRTDVVEVDGRAVLVATVLPGRNKPYKDLSGTIWVKQGADKRRVTENSEILGLFQSSGTYHPEEDAEPGTTTNDLEMRYVRDFFHRVYGKDPEEFDQPFDSLLRSLGIMTADGALTRAGTLFFGRNPQQHERSVVIKAVAFAGNTIGDTNYIDSRDITGTLPWMFQEGMAFLKSYLRHEQRGQNFNTVGILEIPEVVLEELLQNALVHFDLLHHAAIRLLIFSDRVEIINPGCLYGGLKVADIKLGVSRQRNPLMADLAAKTMLYRGLGSGIVRAMRENIHIDFDNEESANQFKATVWKTVQKRNDTKETGKVATSDDRLATLDSKVATSDSKVATLKRRMSKEEMQSRVLDVCGDWMSLEEIAKALDRDKAYLRNKILPLLTERIEMMHASPNHPQQKYRRKQ